MAVQSKHWLCVAPRGPSESGLLADLLGSGLLGIGLLVGPIDLPRHLLEGRRTSASAPASSGARPMSAPMGRMSVFDLKRQRLALDPGGADVLDQAAEEAQGEARLANVFAQRHHPTADVARRGPRGGGVSPEGAVAPALGGRSHSRASSSSRECLRGGSKLYAFTMRRHMRTHVGSAQVQVCVRHMRARAHVRARGGGGLWVSE